MSGTDTGCESPPLREHLELHSGIDALEGQDFSLLIPGPKTKPTHWLSICVPCLFSPRISETALLFATQALEMWARGRGREKPEQHPKGLTLSSPQITAEKELPSWLVAVPRVPWSYFPIPLSMQQLSAFHSPK